MTVGTPLRLLAYTRYGALGASSRVRLLHFIPALRDAGIEVTVRPLLSDDYLRHKYAGRGVTGEIVAAYARRAFQLAQTPNADVVWIEKELWPWAPAWLERGAWHGKPVVLDYDDAVFHNYDLHRLAAVRALYGGKIDALMKRASLVTAGSGYLAGRARSAGATRVEWLPTVVDTARYRVAPAKPHDDGRPLVIGWIGSPATIGYVRALAEPLAALARQRRIVLRLIGAKLDLPGVPVEFVPWAEDREVEAIATFDVGVMPLPDSPWERGKCGYKLVQYMACGLPVVASPVGANMQIVLPGETGFLAANDAEWLSALTRLVDDAALRQRLGAAGRARAEAHYSLHAAAPRLAAWLHGLARPATR